MRAFFLLINFLLLFPIFGQDLPINSEVLMTIDSEEITVDEFMNVYEKNINLVQDKQQKSIKDYLDLYINYKLKLAEARSLGYDKKESYLSEYKGYKEQLIKNYLTDKKITEELLQEAYSRKLEEVKAQHILVRFNSQQDTRSKLNQIQALRNRFLNEDFQTLRKEIHDGQSIFVEDLGYFSAFKMVYDFENAAYNTAVGEISQPFKTQFGYHVVKVLDKRRSRGKAEVAHIMIANNSKDTTQTPEQRINELHRLLLQGESFESLAKQYSDDKSSAANGGKLKPFASGEINSEIFVDTAFNLNEGEISTPIQSQFGWHVIKLYAQIPVEDFENIKYDLEQKVKRDSRSSIIKKKMIESLKKQYQIDAADLPTISNLFVYDNESKEWIFKDTSKKQAQFIKIEDLIFTYDDFLVFLNKKSPKKLNGIQKSNFIAERYGIFLEDQLLEYKKEQLPFENLEYAQILKEYEEGLLLFDIMQEKIWDGAKNDSTGLLAHYQEHINKFSSPAQLTASIARSSKKATLKKTKKLWENGSSNEAITSALNAKEQKVILSSGSFNIDDPLLPKQTQFTTGISSIYSLEDGYVLLNITALAPEKNLSFEASKGAVISSYQETLEKQWIQNLRKKYNFSVNNEMLEALSSKVSQ